MWDDRRIVAERPPHTPLDPWRPHGYFVEPEFMRDGKVEDVATLFLANRECPFKCLMCDLWKYTTAGRVPRGAIPAQIVWGLQQLPPAPHLKLYNAGNFFDAQAIPPDDWPAIAGQLAPFRTLIVECHPLLVGRRCLEFQSLIQPELEIAMGLETVHPDILPRLNKRMTLADFERAVRFLHTHGIRARAFILLRPPFMTEAEGIDWANRSLEFAFAIGVECCVVIPTRAGNGALDRLREAGEFHPPRLESLEEVVENGLGLRAGRVFADLWDIERFYSCHSCGPVRSARLRQINLTQVNHPAVNCHCGSLHDPS